jgi:hypothetical protein
MPSSVAAVSPALKSVFAGPVGVGASATAAAVGALAGLEVPAAVEAVLDVLGELEPLQEPTNTMNPNMPPMTHGHLRFLGGCGGAHSGGG